MVKGLLGRLIFFIEEVIAAKKINGCCTRFVRAAFGG
jgi:hypothetical protein